MTKPDFTIDRTAPRIEVEEILLLEPNERARLASGAREVCESIEDDDSEVWMFTRGGQFLRFTGIEQERCYVTDAEYAASMLTDFADDEVMSALMEAGAFQGVEIRMPTP